MADATIRLLPLDGPWETLGAERMRGIVAENIEATANDWGPDQLSFELKAQPGANRPDLLPYTPVELEIDGIVCWAGRVRERPGTENEHHITCQGWQYHLDDDLLDRVYIHARLADYRDQRTYLTANLAAFTVAGTVATDSGTISLGWPNGAVLPNPSRVGVTLDLGPASTAKRVVIAWDSSNNSATQNWNVRGTDTEDTSAAGESILGQFLNAGATGTSAATFTTARRYIHIYMESGAATLAADLWFRVKSVQVFRLTGYEASNASAVNAAMVVRDVLPTAPQLNQSTAATVDGAFAIPEYLTSGYESPRSVIASVNAYENYRTKIGGADLKTLVFDPKPSAPILEAGSWSGADFSDASVSGDQIYPKAIVDSTGPDGARLVSTRTQTGTLVDRRGYTRAIVLPVRTAVTQAVADRFADLWLSEHKTAPFAGTLSVKGNALRRVLGGASVPAHELLLYAGEKIRLTHRLDPDTGAWGRDGRIAGVTYRHNERATDIAIDDQRDNFAKVLSRYGVLVEQIG